MNWEICHPSLPIKKKGHKLSLLDRISTEPSVAYIFEKLKRLEGNNRNLIVESNKNLYYLIKYIKG